MFDHQETGLLAFQKLIVDADDLGTNPQTLAKLLDVIDNKSVEADKLLPIVEPDMGLTSNLLRLCNSPFYGIRHEVGSVREALVQIGNVPFAKMAFVVSMKKMLQRDLPSYQITMDQAWRHGLMTAIGAAAIMKVIGRPEQSDRAFTAGILHDCGKLLLDHELSGLVAGIPNVDGHISVKMERELTGFDHAEAGAVIMDHWNFPPLLVHAVRCHHNPRCAGEYSEVAMAVHVADKISHLKTLGVEYDSTAKTSAYDELIAFGIAVEDLVVIYDLLPNDTDDMMSLALRGKVMPRN
jgi:putative nucleotidyltransferase with HDIG domain